MAVITAIIFLVFFAFNSFAGQYFCDEMDHFSFEGECKMKEQKKTRRNKTKRKRTNRAVV